MERMWLALMSKLVMVMGSIIMDESFVGSLIISFSSFFPFIAFETSFD